MKKFLILIKRENIDRKIMMALIIIISMLTIVPRMWAVDYISVGSGNWNEDATWDNPGYPDGVDDTVTITNEHTVGITADLTCGAVTINSGGVVNHTAIDGTWIVQGDILVMGTLSLRTRTTTKIAPGLYGIIVESGGVFNAKGDWRFHDCIITALDPDHNTYIYLKDGSQTTLEYCQISEMGRWENLKTGIYIENVDGDMPNEGVLIKDCYISNNEYGIYMIGCSNNNEANGMGIIDTVVWSCRVGIWMFVCSSNTLQNNHCHDNNRGSIEGAGIRLFGGGNNIITGNTCYKNELLGILIEDSNNNTLNSNTCYSQALDGSIRLYNSHSNQLNNNVSYSDGNGIALYESNNNTLTGNISYSNVTGLISSNSTGNELINCNFGTIGENMAGDIYLSDSTLTLKNCQLASTTEVRTTGLINPGSWIISQKHDQIPGVVRIWGDYSIPAGTTNWRYDTELYSGSGDANVQKKIEFYSTPIGTEFIIENGNTLNIIGGSQTNQKTLLYSGDSTFWGFNVNGSINCDYTNFSNLDTNGLNISSGATIIKFDQTSFGNVADGGSHLTIDAIDCSFDGCVFDDSGTYDVTVNNDADLVFVNSTRGNLADNFMDVNSSIQWVEDSITGFIDSGGVDITFYSIETDEIFVTVNDNDENLHNGSQQQVSVTISNSSTGDEEVLTLVETGNDTGIFRNTVGLPVKLNSTATKGNYELEALGTEIVNVTYVDANDPGDVSNDTVRIYPKEPMVISIIPDEGAVGLLPDSFVRVVFNKEMDKTSVESAMSLKVVRDKDGQVINELVSGVFTWENDTTVIFQPNEPLNKNYTYEVVVLIDAQDVEGNPLLGAKDWKFVTIMESTVTNTVLGEDESTEVVLAANALPEDGYIKISLESADQEGIIQAESKLKRQGDTCKYPLDNTFRELNAYDINGNLYNITFNAAVNLTIPYLDNDNDGIVDGTFPLVREKTLAIHYLDENNNLWVRIPGSVVDVESNIVTAKVPHFSTFVLMGANDTNLTSAYAFPVPFRAYQGHNQITFTGLSSQVTIKIFTISGELIVTLKEEDGDGQLIWDVKNKGGKRLASGVYIYYIENEREHKSGKLMIIK
ncbi:right-handed parallel beta-helix repeat-containing protein [bacterium]|nr:right-handed parallel beta-helix repeat-containing protein [bacterium]